LVSILCIVAFFVLFFFAILYENHEYETASFALVFSSIGIFGTLTIYESCRNSKSQTFRFKDVLSDELNSYFNAVNEKINTKIPLMWVFNP
jgi:hypothetical protein